MELEKALELILTLFSNASLALVLGAALCCALTALCKKFLINKTKIDLLHKFDPTPYLPFIFGILFAGVCALFSAEGGVAAAVKENAAAFFSGILSEGLTVGALSTVFYRVFAAVCSGNIKNLQKDDVFNLLYTQILSLSDAKKRLVGGELTLTQFAGEISKLAEAAKALYSDETASEEVKQEKLEEMLSGVLDGDALCGAVLTLHNGLLQEQSVKE